MKATTLLLIAIVVAFISTSAVSIAQDSTKVKTTAVKTIGARVYTQAEFDSLKAELSGLDDSEPVTVEMLRKAMSYVHDVTLRDGHKEYVSMPHFFKKQVMNDAAAKFDTVTDGMKTMATDINTVANKTTVAIEASKATTNSLTNIEGSVNGLTSRINDVDNSIVGQSNRLDDVETFVAKDDTEVVVNGNRIEAREAALERIKARVAARRAVAPKQ